MTANPRSTLQRGVFLSSFFAALYAVPYLVPVQPVVSVSYVVGYSNRALLLLFVAGAAAFAAWNGDSFATEEQPGPGAGRVSWGTLWVALAIVTATCVFRLRLDAVPGAEAAYFLNRLQMYGSGLRLYKDFEFAYGPMLLCLPLAISRLTHATLRHSYYVAWMLQWWGGTAMLWASFRLLPMRMRRPQLVFGGFFAWLLFAIIFEGEQYTPVRLYAAVFLLVALHAAWRRTRQPYLLSAAGILACAFAFAVSPEQGVGTTFGLLMWLAVLLYDGRRTGFRLPAFALFVAGLALLVAWLSHLGSFLSLRQFAGGAYSLPLLASPPTVLVLVVYVVAACALLKDVRAKQFESIAVPLVLGGTAMLPAALGRCDPGHLQLAYPAFLLGVVLIEGMPRVRRWWSPLAVTFLIAIPFLMLFENPVRARLSALRHGTAVVPVRALTLQGTERYFGEPGPTLPFHAPCQTMYRTLQVWSSFDAPAADNCLLPGYYLSNVDVFTEAAIARKLAELQSHPSEPLLMLNLPLDQQMIPQEVSAIPLRRIELTPFLPRLRHAPLGYQPILEYVAAHYRPAPEPVGLYRVWYPK